MAEITREISNLHLMGLDRELREALPGKFDGLSPHPGSPVVRIHLVGDMEPSDEVLAKIEAIVAAHDPAAHRAKEMADRQAKIEKAVQTGDLSALLLSPDAADVISGLIIRINQLEAKVSEGK